MMRKVVTRLVWLAVLGGLAAGGWWWWQRRQQSAAREARGQVRTEVVAKGKLTVKAAASGTITPHRKVDVKSRASGEVVEILVKPGQAVAANALLVRLDPYNAERELDRRRTTLAELQAQLQEALAGVGVAQLQSKEAKSDARVQSDGVDMGLVAPNSRRTSKNQAAIASKTVVQRQAQVARIEAQITSAKVDVTIAERTVAETQIHAPFAGTVLNINIEIGDIVASAVTNFNGGTALLTLADLSDLRVVGQVDEAQIARVKGGQPAEIRVDAYPDRAFEGRVEAVSLIGVNVTNVVSFDVEVVVTDKDRALLRPGMTADVEIAAQTVTNVVVIPLSAILTKGTERFVRMADGSERKVEVGPHDQASIAVIAGLEVGEAIQPIGAQPKDEAGAPKGMFQMGGGRGRR